MGKRTDYELYGWGPNGRFLSAFEKEEIQDLVFDEGVDDYGCNHGATEPDIMSFGSDYFGAYDDVRKALSGYASRNPEVLLELEYTCEDDHVHQLIRFKGDEVEEHDRIEIYPPFIHLTLSDDVNPLPVLEFHFDSIDGVTVSGKLYKNGGWFCSKANWARIQLANWRTASLPILRACPRGALSS